VGNRKVNSVLLLEGITMKGTKPWHEDDSFWKTWGSMIFTSKRIEDAAGEIDKVIDLLKLAPGDNVLDLCCGVGRHSLELTRRGFQVTGVDRTEQYLNKASEQAEREGLNVEFIREDMRTFCRPDTFNATISMFTSFSYFEDPEEDRQVVLNVYRSLKAGGVFLLEMHGKETLARIFREKDWSETNGVFILYDRKVSQNWGWMENRWIMFKDNKHTESIFSHRLYAATELIALLTGCGFSSVDIYGSLDGDPYDHKAQRLIAIGHK